MRSIFVASTGQNVGKTTTALGLFAALRTRFAKVGYFKPVGQQTCQLEDGTLIDKDVELFRRTFALKDPPELMSPVVIPKGTTRNFLDGNCPVSLWEEKIKSSFESLCRKNDFVLCEGTGHVGVGSIIGLDNAKVARLIQTDLILVSKAGLGKAIDQIHLNACLLNRRHCRLRGIVLNQVRPEKKEMLQQYIPKALAQSALLKDSTLMGLIPYCQRLSSPSLDSLSALFETQVFASDDAYQKHFQEVKQLSLDLFSSQRPIDPTLYFVSKSRADHAQKVLQDSSFLKQDQDALIFCGSGSVEESVLNALRVKGIPYLLTEEPIHRAIQKVNALVSKISADDQKMVRLAIAHVSSHLNLNFLLRLAPETLTSQKDFL